MSISSKNMYILVHKWNKPYNQRGQHIFISDILRITEHQQQQLRLKIQDIVGIDIQFIKLN